MRMQSLVSICTCYVCEHMDSYTDEMIGEIPQTLQKIMLGYLSAFSLHRLQTVFALAEINTSSIWRLHSQKRWLYKSSKMVDIFGDDSDDPHQIYMEKHFHDIVKQLWFDAHLDAENAFHTCLHRFDHDSHDVSPEANGVRAAALHPREALYAFAVWVERLSLLSMQCNVFCEDPKLMSLLWSTVRRLSMNLLISQNYSGVRKFMHILHMRGKLEHCIFEVKLSSEEFRDLLRICSGQVCGKCFVEDVRQISQCVDETAVSAEYSMALTDSITSQSGYFFDSETEGSETQNVETKLSKDEPYLQREHVVHDDHDASQNTKNNPDDSNVTQEEDLYDMLESTAMDVDSPNGADDLYDIAVEPLLQGSCSAWQNTKDILECVKKQTKLVNFMGKICWKCQSKIKPENSLSGKFKVHSLSSLTLVNLTCLEADACLIEVLPQWKKLKKFALMHSYIQSEPLKHMLLHCVSLGRFTHLIIEETYLCNNIMDFVIDVVWASKRKGDEAGLILLKLNNNMQTMNCTSFPQWGSFKGIRCLDLSFNTFTTSGIDGLVQILHSVESLTEVKLESCSLRSEWLVRILTTLAGGRCQILSLSNNTISGPGVEKLLHFIEKSPNLAQLSLASCSLTPELVSSEDFTRTLKNHASLQKLDISSNRLGDAACLFLKKMYTADAKANLNSLDISFNSISGNSLLKVAQHLSRVSFVWKTFIFQELRLSGNKVDIGSFPAIVSAFRGVTHNLEGQILGVAVPLAEHISQM